MKQQSVKEVLHNMYTKVLKMSKTSLKFIKQVLIKKQIEKQHYGQDKQSKHYCYVFIVTPLKNICVYKSCHFIHEVLSCSR